MRTRYELEHLSTDELLASMHEVLQHSHQATAELLAHLAEVDRRELYLSLAHPSMFQYAVDELGLSEAEAFMRITAARTARRFPVIFEQVATGALHLTAIKLVAPYLTEENHLSLLEAVSHKSRRDIELELARRFPKEDVPQQLRRLPVARRPVMANSARAELFTRVATQPQPPAQAAPVQATDSTSARAELSSSKVPLPLPQPTTAAVPLAEQRYKLQMTLSEGTHRKLRTAQQLLRHQVPSGDLAAVLDQALDALIAARMKRKYGATKRPRSGAGAEVMGGGASMKAAAATTKEDSAPASTRDTTAVTSCSIVRTQRSTPRSRHVPNAVKREVVQRDGMQCSFVDARGRRCSETGALELHHVQPFARNGEHSAENLRVYCRRHNAHAAELDYGAALMETKRRRSPDCVRDPRAVYAVRPAALTLTQLVPSSRRNLLAACAMRHRPPSGPGDALPQALCPARRTFEPKPRRSAEMLAELIAERSWHSVGTACARPAAALRGADEHAFRSHRLRCTCRARRVPRRRAACAGERARRHAGHLPRRLHAGLRGRRGGAPQLRGLDR